MCHSTDIVAALDNRDTHVHSAIGKGRGARTASATWMGDSALVPSSCFFTWPQQNECDYRTLPEKAPRIFAACFNIA